MTIPDDVEYQATKKQDNPSGQGGKYQAAYKVVYIHIIWLKCITSQKLTKQPGAQ